MVAQPAVAQRSAASAALRCATFAAVRQTLVSFLEPPISGDPAESAAKLAWLVRLRWIALIAQLLAIYPALQFQILDRALLPTFIGIIAILALLNIVTRASLTAESQVSPAHLFFQLGADIAALSGLLAITGGAWNPLAPILFVHSVIGALLLPGRLSLIFLGLLVGCLITIQAFSFIPPGLSTALLPARILFPAQLLVALVFWMLTAWLSGTLSSLQSHYSFLQERSTRIDRLRAVGALAAGLSHEFATPLNTAQLRVKRVARTLDLGENPDVITALEALDRCRDVLRHMTGSQLHPERLSLEAVEVDDLVRRVCSSIESESSSPVRFNVEGRGNRTALLPAIAFSQAMINLIDNARESGGEEEPVDVTVENRTSTIEVRVLDRGEGWPEIVRRHFGEPFVTTKPNGVGLGLYFVHNLTESMGAEFHLDDREEGGAVARISLPSFVSPTGTAEAIA